MYHVKADVMPELYWHGLIKYVVEYLIFVFLFFTFL